MQYLAARQSRMKRKYAKKIKGDKPTLPVEKFPERPAAHPLAIVGGDTRMDVWSEAFQARVSDAARRLMAGESTAGILQDHGSVVLEQAKQDVFQQQIKRIGYRNKV